jgi:L-ascorbate metabolism protein UlaG (beta-lactamase superfamily)
MWTRRRTEPALGPDQLPHLDAVFLSHLHGDHFDRVARRALARDIPLVTTGHAADRLRRKGFEATVPLAPWSGTEFIRGDRRLRVTAVPGRHGPAPVDRLLTPPVIGFVLELDGGDTEPLRVYITGDVVFTADLARVTERFPELDTMIVHLGGTRVLGLLLTMDGRQGADLVELVRPPVTIPIHYDDYRAFRSPLADFLTEVRRRDLPGTVRVVRRGETVPLRLVPATVGDSVRSGA